MKSRELYLFRGKTQKGEWVEGDLVRDRKISYIFVDKLDVTFLSKFKSVIPETIGLWSGKTDKNGIKIFEGDKVRVTIEGKTFETIASYNIRWSLKYVDKWKTKYYSIPTSKNIEIIGNLWDNRELLEAK